VVDLRKERVSLDSGETRIVWVSGVMKQRPVSLHQYIEQGEACGKDPAAVHNGRP
jgi:hypothetical protein